jgi:ABC-2 type transport system permease protein
MEDKIEKIQKMATKYGQKLVIKIKGIDFSFLHSLNTKNIKYLLKRLEYYFKIWIFMSKNSFLMVLNQKSVLLIFLAGKILRFAFFLAFLFLLVSGVDTLAGYNPTQAIFFFLTFMVIDTTAQFFFREVYRFRSHVVSGDFDLILVKPISALFRTLMGGADVIDLVTIPPLYFTVIYVGHLLSPTPLQVFIYLLLIFVGLIITTAFHIIVMSLGIITFEVDHTMMIYRDVTSMGRFPTDIYKEPLKSVLTYFIPVAVMMSLPAKALMGLASGLSIFIAILLAFVFMFVSLRFWEFALKKYSSASS